MYYAKNPILPGFCPDPSICRVGEDYYIVNSSFAYFPGVPIFHSKDLATWKQIGNVLDRPSQLPLTGCGHSQGIFAPTIRYHEGTYYMITTNISAGGNFFVTSDSPTGPWSEPYFLGPEAAGIDPSLFFDEDGKCYYVGTRPRTQGVRYNGDWEIWVQELDLEKKKLVGESKKIWKGALHHAIWPEGPHLYKRNDYYYLLHAEGGTGMEHAISVARSKNIWGPYEGDIKNPIFSHRQLGAHADVVATGHGDLVEAADGNWYIVMLASRRLNCHGNMGRDTYLAKVTWENDWPVINAGIGILENRVALPGEGKDTEGVSSRWHFDNPILPHNFIMLRNHEQPCYSLQDKEGCLRLYAGCDSLCGTGTPAYVGVRQRDFYGEVKTVLSLQGENVEAGLCILCDDKTHFRVGMKREDGCTYVVATKCTGTNESVLCKGTWKEEELEIVLILNGNALDVCVDGNAEDRKTLLKDVDTTFLSLESTGGFTGCTIGMYALGIGQEKAFADFSLFEYTDGFC